MILTKGVPVFLLDAHKTVSSWVYNLPVNRGDCYCCIYVHTAGVGDEQEYLCSSSKTYVINDLTETVPLNATKFGFGPALLMTELMLTNVMMVSVLIAIFTWVVILRSLHHSPHVISSEMNWTEHIASNEISHTAHIIRMNSDNALQSVESVEYIY